VAGLFPGESLLFLFERYWKSRALRSCLYIFFRPRRAPSFPLELGCCVVRDVFSYSTVDFLAALPFSCFFDLIRISVIVMRPSLFEAPRAGFPLFSWFSPLSHPPFPPPPFSFPSFLPQYLSPPQPPSPLLYTWDFVPEHSFPIARAAVFSGT